MLYKYFTEKLLGLQDVDIEKLEETDNSIHINCRLKRKPHKCPCCGNLTDKVQDYREQPKRIFLPLASTSLFILISVDIVAHVASVFVIVFYICFLTKCKNKRQLVLLSLVHFNSSFSDLPQLLTQNPILVIQTNFQITKKTEQL